MNPYPGQVLRRCGSWELIRDLGPCGRVRSFKAWDPLDERFVTVVVLAGIDALELVKGTAELEASLAIWTEGKIPASTVILDFDPGGLGEDPFIVLERPPDDEPPADAEPADDAPAFFPEPDDEHDYTEAQSAADPPAESEPSDDAPGYTDTQPDAEPVDDAPTLSFASDDEPGYTDTQPDAEPPAAANPPAAAPVFSFATDDEPDDTEAQPVVEPPANADAPSDALVFAPEPDDGLDYTEAGPETEPTADPDSPADAPVVSPEPDDEPGYADEGVDIGEPEFTDTSVPEAESDEPGVAETLLPVSSAEPSRLEKSPLKLGKTGPGSKTLIGVIAGTVTGAALLGFAVRSVILRDELDTSRPQPRSAAAHKVAPPTAEPNLAAAEGGRTLERNNARKHEAAPATAKPIAVAKAEVTLATQPTRAPSPAQEAVPVRERPADAGVTPAARVADATGSESVARQNREPEIAVNVLPPTDRETDHLSMDALDRTEIHDKVESWLEERESLDRRRVHTKDARYALKDVQISPRGPGAANVTVTYEINNPSDGAPGLKTVKFFATGQRGFWQLNPFLVD